MSAAPGAAAMALGLAPANAAVVATASALLALAAAAAGAWVLACVLHGAVRRLRAARSEMPRRTPRLPRWLRAALPAAIALGGPLGPRVPVALRHRAHRWLVAAEVEEEVLAQQFLALCALHLGAGVAIALAPWPLRVAGLVVGAAVAALPLLWLRDAIRRREWEILRDLSVYVDMLTLALEAGGALSVALRAATERMPDSALRRAFTRVQNDLRAGRSRAEALRALGERVDTPAVNALVAALVQAESRGGSLSGVLRSQSEQRLGERFARAERLALEAPVKLLAPLILCIFPCTFLVLAFPVVIRFMEAP